MNPTTIPTDIYRMLITKKLADGADVEAIADTFAEECREAFVQALGPPQVREGSLRLSAVGKPNRQLYNAFHGVVGEELTGSTYIKFLYGHIIEALVLALTEASGHEVTEKQKECVVEGVKGHQDARIDGVLCDVKSASAYGFKKFKNRQMPFDDAFGYVAQMKAYAAHEGDTKYGWLVMDKQSGELVWSGYDEATMTEAEKEVFDYDIRERVIDVKKLVAGDLPPLCYQPVPDGKSGNVKLAVGCSYCAFKATCFPGLRTFIYANGPKYLTVTNNVPKVTEVIDGF